MQGIVGLLYFLTLFLWTFHSCFCQDSKNGNECPKNITEASQIRHGLTLLDADFFNDIKVMNFSIMTSFQIILLEVGMLYLILSSLI